MFCLLNSRQARFRDFSKPRKSLFLSPTKFLAAVTNLCSFTATRPGIITHFMLKRLPRLGMDFLLHIFNLSWSLHFFPSTWKISSIISIHKIGKPLKSPVSFWSMSLTFCVPKLFECIILSCLLFLLKSNFILYPHQAGFCPCRSTVHQILFLSYFILNGLNKPKPGSRAILATIDFSKLFNSVWPPSLLCLLDSRQERLRDFSKPQTLFLSSVSRFSAKIRS